MKLEIFGEEVKEAEKIVTLRLSVVHAHSVALYAVDDKGNCLPAGHVLTISPEGITRTVGVNQYLGFTRGLQGQIVDIS